MMAEKTNWENKTRQMHFDGNVSMVWGFINLVFSHLPTRILRLLMFVGLSTDRETGVKLLRSVTENYTKMSKYLAASFLICFYSFYLIQFFGEWLIMSASNSLTDQSGLGEVDVAWLQSVTERALEENPNGMFNVFWAARTQQVKGQSTAIELFERCLKIQDEMPQFHNVIKWDLLWCYAINRNWHRAADLALELQNNCHVVAQL